MPLISLGRRTGIVQYNDCLSRNPFGQAGLRSREELKQYEKLSNNEFKKMKNKLVIDCRRMLAQKQLDTDYYAIGIGRE